MCYLSQRFFEIGITLSSIRFVKSLPDGGVAYNEEGIKEVLKKGD